MKEIDYHLSPCGPLIGECVVPGDKSISHRSVIFASLAEGSTIVNGFLPGLDCLATVQAFQEMGVKIERLSADTLKIEGVGLHGLKPPANPLDLGNSGTSMRLLAGLLSAQSFDSELIGDASLSNRPMNRVIKPLTQMGARIESNDGKAPLKIKGGQSLEGIDYVSPVSSAQVKSCLLLAALYAQGETRYSEPGVSRDHTERMLVSFGYPINKGEHSVALKARKSLQASTIDVPGDISSAVFLIVAATIVKGSNLVIKNVGVNPTRIGAINILKAMGADITLNNKRLLGDEPVADIQVAYAPLEGIEIPLSQVALAIDEFPVLFVAASVAKGRTILKGAKELRVKESDRIQTMAEGLSRLGVTIEVLPDGAVIEGGSLCGGEVLSYKDHRIAMAFSMAAMAARDSVVIKDCAAIATSFPNFLNIIHELGVPLTVKACDMEGEKMTTEVPLVTIDGPSGTGKGTLCQQLAEKFKWNMLDSGALYRVLALAAKQHAVDLDNEPALDVLAAHLDTQFKVSLDSKSSLVILEGEDVTDLIRSEECGNDASKIAVLPVVRKSLLERQRAFAESPGLVTDGRDMGTVVFPTAMLKIYLTASAEIRAERRYSQLKEKGINASLAQIVEELDKRDKRDQNRKIAPLQAASDAVVIDTTTLNAMEVFEKVLALVQERLAAQPLSVSA